MAEARATVDAEATNQEPELERRHLNLSLNLNLNGHTSNWMPRAVRVREKLSFPQSQ